MSTPSFNMPLETPPPLVALRNIRQHFGQRAPRGWLGRGLDRLLPPAQPRITRAVDGVSLSV